MRELLLFKVVIAFVIAGVAAFFVLMAIYERRCKERRAEHPDLAHCRCGDIMSEWFVHEGLMWHPVFAGGCGWVSPWENHEDYRRAERPQAGTDAAQR